ncbi:uncharacterized protein BP5553_06513 [Venustampulla echinocandica]|uniref:MFS maltose permease n=1 Tax=Venustampulla echinocandica TaxID=2656787 RepID=A0A370TK46_9HELO|nr:uncharacterized protein BP5553_06513 [Venustampulla echinocandica]RDL35901.1 hypothetical protein BP5553_06513 [Venustampulla echinocandica]
MRVGIATPARRMLQLRPFRPPNFNSLRLSLSHSTLNPGPTSRPHIPYLSPPSRRLTARFVTTETKAWIKDEVKKGFKWTAYLYTFVFLFFVMGYGAHQEWTNRLYHPPPEWSWISRVQYMMANWHEDEENMPGNYVQWVTIGSYYRILLLRLEDPNIDGAGLLEQGEGGILVEGIGKTGYDISAKSESWRRGYYNALMGAAVSAEHLEDSVKDEKRRIIMPKSMVPGPSNPNPRPPPPGTKVESREEDCEKAYELPEVFYMRILTTRGFTEKQRVDAALGYAAYLDFKGTHNAAMNMYEWALDIATENPSGSTPQPAIDRATGILNPNAGPPSANLLAVTTAIAVHHALASNISLALPIFLSVLRARRSLPEDPSSQSRLQATEEEKSGLIHAAISYARAILIPPPYPPPPDDGTSPPKRTPKERCEEAGIMGNIGEILYASKKSNRSKEEGLAWTREAVDIAEEQLTSAPLDKEAKTACKQCLGAAIENWDKMVARLAKEEKEAKAQGGKVGGWLGFGGEEQKDVIGRWESEENVVRERIIRANELLVSLSAPPPARKGSFLTA